MWKFIPPKKKNTDIYIRLHGLSTQKKKKKNMKINVLKNFNWVGLFFKFWAIEFFIKNACWQTIRQDSSTNYQQQIPFIILNAWLIMLEFECNVIYACVFVLIFKNEIHVICYLKKAYLELVTTNSTTFSIVWWLLHII